MSSSENCRQGTENNGVICRKRNMVRTIDIPSHHLLVLFLGASYFVDEMTCVQTQELFERKTGLDVKVSEQELWEFARYLAQELQKMGVRNCKISFPSIENQEEWISIISIDEEKFYCTDECLETLHEYFIGLLGTYPLPCVRKAIKKMNN